MPLSNQRRTSATTKEASSFPRKFIGLLPVSSREPPLSIVERIENMTNERRLSRAGKKLKVNFNRIERGKKRKRRKDTRWNKVNTALTRFTQSNLFSIWDRKEDTLRQPGSRFVTSVSVIFTGSTR